MDINHVNIFSLILGIQRPKIDCGKCKHMKYVYMCILYVCIFYFYRTQVYLAMLASSS